MLIFPLQPIIKSKLENIMLLVCAPDVFWTFCASFSFHLNHNLPDVNRNTLTELDLLQWPKGDGGYVYLCYKPQSCQNQLSCKQWTGNPIHLDLTIHAMGVSTLDSAKLGLSQIKVNLNDPWVWNIDLYLAEKLIWVELSLGENAHSVLCSLYSV